MYICTELGHFLFSATNLKISSATFRKISRSEILFLVPQRTPDDCHWNYSAVSHARLKHNVPGILHLAVSPWSKTVGTEKFAGHMENNRGPAILSPHGLAILVVSVRCLSRRRASASQTQRRTSWSRRAPVKHTAGYHSSSETPTAELDHFFASPLLTSPDINLFRLVCLA